MVISYHVIGENLPAIGTVDRKLKIFFFNSSIRFFFFFLILAYLFGANYFLKIH